MVITKYNWLFGYLMKAKITVELWASEIRAEQFCDRESAKSTVKIKIIKKGVGGRDPNFFFLLCIWKNEHF